MGPRNPALWSRELPSAKVGPYPNTSLGMLAAGYLLAGSWGEKKKRLEGTEKGAVATGKLLQGKPVSAQR